MKLEVRGHQMLVSDAMRQHVERRLAFAIGRFAPRVRRTTVRLQDVNGPRGGVDKSCRIAVALPWSRDMVIEDADRDMYVAIDRAAERAARAIERHLARRRDVQRMHGVLEEGGLG